MRCVISLGGSWEAANCACDRRSANASYWVFPAFRGHGYAVRALVLLCTAASQVAGLNRLEVRISPDNGASRRVAESAAFMYAGAVQEEGRTGALSTMLSYVKEVGDP